MTKNEFILMLIATFIASVIWVGADIYHARAQVTISSDLQKALEPVDPTLDLSALNKISTPPPVATPSATAKPTATPRPTPLPSLIPLATPDVTSSSASPSP